MTVDKEYLASPMPIAVDFSHPDARCAEKAGRKAANLASLHASGFQVPEGYIVTTASFDAFVQGEAQSNSALRNKPVPANVKQALADIAERYGSKPLAVRSSGTLEDLEGASFAGQYETVLGVKGEQELLAAVKRCWLSAFDAHAASNRESGPGGPNQMAVLIQPMIDADCAGVAFTVNPVSGNRDETVINAVKGLGDKLVSGEVTPDEWTIANGRAKAVHLPEQAATEAQILQIGRLARKVEGFFGRPQDIEWAMEGESLYLLQARPVTSMDKEDQEASFPKTLQIDVPDGYWRREKTHYPEPLYPITLSTCIPCISEGFRSMFAELSLFIENIEMREIGGYIYQRVVPFGGREGKSPPNWLLSLLMKIVPKMRKRIKDCRRYMEEDHPAKSIDQWREVWKPALIRKLQGLRAIKLTELTDGELIQQLGDRLEFLRNSLVTHMRLSGALIMQTSEVFFACRELLKWDEEKTLHLFGGLSEMSSEPAVKLAQLGTRAKQNPKLMELLEAPDKHTMERISKTDPSWASEFEQYLADFGYRPIRYGVCNPTLLETPELILKQLKSQWDAGYDPVKERQQLQQRRAQAKKDAFQALANQPEKLKEFRRILIRGEKAYPVREEHGFYDASQALAHLRFAILEAAKRLAGKGLLANEHDVLFCEFPELISGLQDNVPLMDAVRMRKARRILVLRHQAPDSYGTPPPPPPPSGIFKGSVRFAHEAALWALQKNDADEESSRMQKGGSEITGIPVSSGTYTGRVCLILNESQFHKLNAGDVMVCPITSPAWSILFAGLGALVTDSGGTLSHSAIIAREYGIPCVTAAGNATRILRDGQLVTVNGTSGSITIHEGG